MGPDNTENLRDSCLKSIRNAIAEDDSATSEYQEKMIHLDKAGFRELIRKIYDRLRKR